MKTFILQVYNRIKKDVIDNRVGILAFVGIFILLFVVFDNVCPSQIFFGFPCPGCGLTRAGVLLLRFRFVDAWEMHPFIYAWLYLALYLCYKRYIRGKQAKGILAMVVVIALAMVVFYVYRLYYFYPNVEPLVPKETSLYHTFRDILNRFAD